MWQSFKEYVPAVFGEIWALGMGVVVALLGAVALTVSGFAVAWWIYAVIAVACLSPAQFRAFHKVRLARDERAQTVGGSVFVQTLNVHIVLPSQPPP